MPSYDFICEGCGYKECRMVAITYPKISKCPSCDELKLVRCIGSGAGFSISGLGVHNSGFHSHKKKEVDMNAKEDCEVCKGKGWYLVRTGEDDFDREVCDCVE